jgi:hypothetical protein
MDNNNNHDYEMGLRDGKIASLEASVTKIAEDMSKFRIALYMLYGAIAMVQFLPTIEGMLRRAGP